MRFNGKGYLASKTNDRARLLPKPKDCLEDYTEAFLCDVKWEVEMNKPDAYDLNIDDVEIE